MEQRLIELVRDYQDERANLLGGRIPEFRETPLRRFAKLNGHRYPEYVLDDGRLSAAISEARAAGEIIPPRNGRRDEYLMLRADSERSPS